MDYGLLWTVKVFQAFTNHKTLTINLTTDIYIIFSKKWYVSFSNTL